MLYIVIGLVFGLAGYLEGRRFEKEYGRTPWGWHPLVWGVILGLSFAIGVVLLAVAERVGRKAAASRARNAVNVPAWPVSSSQAVFPGSDGPAAPGRQW